jgi:Lipase (class 3)
MAAVNLERARQLVRASSVAYSRELGDPATGTLAIEAGFDELDKLQMIIAPSGRDAVLVGRTAFGVVAAFRGTLPPTETDPKRALTAALDWINDFGVAQVVVPYATGRVHNGFHGALENLWPELFPAIVAAAEGGRRVFLTGHSKGGALAALAAIRLKTAGIVPAGVMTFGAPKTGNEKFAAAYDLEVPSHWSFEHQDDIVPHLPPTPFALPTILNLQPLKSLAGPLKRLKEQTGAATVAAGLFQSYARVGNLCFLDWDDRLREGVQPDLASHRQSHIVAAGAELLFDHFLDGSHLASGKRGYLESIDGL